MKIFCLVGVCILLIIGPAGAAIIHQSDSVSFTSDLEPNKTITLNSFDTTDTTGCPPGGWRELNTVTVTVTYDGSAGIIADNDDPLKSGTVNARIIRTWSMSGPGALAGFGTKMVTTTGLLLQADDGDLSVFDPSPPDGKDFGALSFAGEPAAGSPYTPTKSAYETAGAGTVDFVVDVATMVNDLQWDVTPDAWQMEVQNPVLTVMVDLDYDWTCVPEPATLSLLALGGLALIRRRSRIR